MNTTTSKPIPSKLAPSEELAQAKNTLEYLIHNTCCLLGDEQVSTKEKLSGTQEFLQNRGLKNLTQEAFHYLEHSNGDAFRATLKSILAELK